MSGHHSSPAASRISRLAMEELRVPTSPLSSISDEASDDELYTEGDRGPAPVKIVHDLVSHHNNHPHNDDDEEYYLVPPSSSHESSRLRPDRSVNRHSASGASEAVQDEAATPAGGPPSCVPAAHHLILSTGDADSSDGEEIFFDPRLLPSPAPASVPRGQPLLSRRSPPGPSASSATTPNLRRTSLNAMPITARLFASTTPQTDFSASATHGKHQEESDRRGSARKGIIFASGQNEIQRIPDVEGRVVQRPHKGRLTITQQIDELEALQQQFQRTMKRQDVPPQVIAARRAVYYSQQISSNRQVAPCSSGSDMPPSREVDKRCAAGCVESQLWSPQEKPQQYQPPRDYLYSTVTAKATPLEGKEGDSRVEEHLLAFEVMREHRQQEEQKHATPRHQPEGHRRPQPVAAKVTNGATKAGRKATQREGSVCAFGTSTPRGTLSTHRQHAAREPSQGRAREQHGDVPHSPDESWAKLPQRMHYRDPLVLVGHAGHGSSPSLRALSVREIISGEPQPTWEAPNTPRAGSCGDGHSKQRLDRSNQRAAARRQRMLDYSASHRRQASQWQQANPKNKAVDAVTTATSEATSFETRQDDRASVSKAADRIVPDRGPLNTWRMLSTRHLTMV